MTQYVLHISSYGGLVPGAVHCRGRVEGPHPKPCHGNRTHHDGYKTVCDEGHELPGQVRWDVEAAWTVERHDRWAARDFEGDGPQQFDSKRDVMDRAVIQFLDGSDFPCEKVDPAAEGDELWYGWISPEGGQFDDLQDPEDGWGMMIARRCTT